MRKNVQERRLDTALQLLEPAIVIILGFFAGVPLSGNGIHLA
ncbi:hypothetical protein [Cohnella nanjingensis]|nr:hypothetical protein [Cohnella nanjingensis]